MYDGYAPVLDMSLRTWARARETDESLLDLRMLESLMLQFAQQRRAWGFAPGCIAWDRIAADLPLLAGSVEPCHGREAAELARRVRGELR